MSGTRWSCLALLCSCVLLAACGGKKGGPMLIDPAPYAGPEVVFANGTRTHRVEVIAPTGGWNVTLNTVRDEFEVRRAFVTITGPDPGDVVSQAQVRHALDLGISLQQNAEVYARQTTRGVPPPEGYRLVGRAEKR